LLVTEAVPGGEQGFFLFAPLFARLLSLSLQLLTAGDFLNAMVNDPQRAVRMKIWVA